MYTVKHQQSLTDILMSCRLSWKESKGLINHLQLVEQHQSIHGVLLEVKERFRALLASEHDSYRKHADGTWRGPWRPVKRLSQKGRKGFRFALRILKMIGIFRAEEPKYRDYAIHGGSISARAETLGVPGGFPLNWKPYNRIAQRIPVAIKKRLAGIGYESPYPLQAKNVPLGRFTHKAECFCTPRDHILTLDNCPRLVIRHYLLFFEIVGESLPEMSHYETLVRTTPHDVVGVLRLLTKDRAMKLRAIVSPFSILQLACHRLAMVLKAYLRLQPEIWAFDQDGGASWVEEQLRAGVKLSSIDIKAATENIPLAPQLALVEACFPWLKQDLEVFRSINRSYWWSPYKSFDLLYTFGNGAGVEGSFYLLCFFLLHLTRDAGASRRCAVCGDDLVVEARYTSAILVRFESLGIPVNESKSLFDSNTAEFVGRVIDHRGNLGVYKASELDLKRDPTGLLRQYGRRALRFGLNRLRWNVRKKIVKFYYAFPLYDRRVMAASLKKRSARLKLRGRTQLTPLQQGGLPETLGMWYLLNSVGNKPLRHKLIKNVEELKSTFWAAGFPEDEISKQVVDVLTESVGQLREGAFYRVVEHRRVVTPLTPSWDVNLWYFPHNVSGVAEALNAEAERKLDLSISAKSDIVSDSGVSGHRPNITEEYHVTEGMRENADHEASDVRGSLEDAAERKLYSSRKAENERLLRNITPLKQMLKVLKLVARATKAAAKQMVKGHYRPKGK